jgi:UDP-glucose 4-epimerase
MSRIFVTGAAGFVGSNLVDRLLARGDEVTGYDNLSTGRIEFLAEATKHPKFRLKCGDILDLKTLQTALQGSDFIFHLAANADVRFGLERPQADLQQNVIGTWNVLEAMRLSGVRRLALSSTGSVYGEAAVIPTPEDCPFPIQTSLYGASKLAGEAFIQAYCEGYGMSAYIFRFVSILGERYTHGHVFDFYKQLIEHPEVLFVQGDGTQRKSYLYVQDCIDAMLWAIDGEEEKVTILNLGADEYCQVKDSIGYITDYLGLQPRIEYAGGSKGWIGDNPFIYLDTRRIRERGWSNRLTIRESIQRTVQYLLENRWALSRQS